MNAGTLADLLIRKHYCNHRTVEAWFSGWSYRITVNGVPAVSVWRVLEFGDLVRVDGEVCKID